VLENEIEKWRAAQLRAHQLERAYTDAMVAYARSLGPSPPEELRTELVSARKLADELLTVALSNINRRIDEQDRKLR
jgi:hypothetical protein